MNEDQSDTILRTENSWDPQQKSVALKREKAGEGEEQGSKRGVDAVMFAPLTHSANRSEAGKIRLMSQHLPAKCLILSDGSCIPQLPSFEGCSLTLTVLNHHTLVSHRGGHNINHSVAAGVLTWGTAPAENSISAQ